MQTRLPFLFLVPCLAGLTASSLACKETVPLCVDTPTDPRCMDAGRDTGAGPDSAADSAVDASDADAGDSAVDAGPCGMECTGMTPMCNATTGMCVACLLDTDCTDAAAAKCGTGGVCGSCDDSSQCGGISGTLVCAPSGGNTGQCVECTEAELSACSAGHPCNPNTNACSSFEAGMIGACGSCDTDTNCSVAESGCVELTFGGAARGGYCLARAAAGGLCPARPFTTKISRETLSGAASADYCGIPEDLTTCDAVLAGNGGECTASMTPGDCAAEGALCETIDATPNQCTYPCARPLDCYSSLGCTAGFCQ